MFRKERTVVPFEGKIENIIGPKTHFKGHLVAEGNLRIDGLFEGTLETNGNVVVGESAKVAADIKANNVQVWGSVQGNVTATGRLEILPAGSVWGDVKVKSLLIDEGGSFHGKSVSAGDDQEPPPIEGPLSSSQEN
ncbi:MAG TPA: polymer-forming cytoskeletal protein [Anaerolineae bacterium]|jgi:cytoskeletal protein CcmA (bactofilin family)|nr:polymer-forming cytoskeletal protein [Anaerolineae bacterium]HNT05807.1 polymer-forming cytoskeletal protein [Anaerolineae bacterium]HOU24527.1 polymer-forming cytoskeletal protein [Anaerolineae bacterium]HQJ52220.1 polymer-forming cytoskeletal protein [Anaerolineae bacterium]